MAVLCNQLLQPVQGALIRGQSPQSTSLRRVLRQSPSCGHRKLSLRTEEQLGPVPAVCTEEEILPRVCVGSSKHTSRSFKYLPLMINSTAS